MTQNIWRIIYVPILASCIARIIFFSYIYEAHFKNK